MVCGMETQNTPNPMWGRPTRLSVYPTHCADDTAETRVGMNSATTQKSVTLTESDSGLTMSVNNVGILCVAGGTYAEISYGLTGQMSVRLDNPSDAVGSLFASADAEFKHAREVMRRAMRMRNAAWKISKERSAVAS